MKTSTVGLVLAAILMVVAGVGFGIAQAGGNQSYDPMMSIGDQDVNPDIVVAKATRGAVETGSLPEIEEHNYLGGEDIDSPIVGTEEHNYLGGEDIDE